MNIRKEWYINLKKLQAVLVGRDTNLVSDHYCQLLVRGVGFKFWKNGNFLYLDVGLTHYTAIRLPTGIKGTIRKNRILFQSKDSQQLHNLVNSISRIRKPDPYKGKGIRLASEELLLKVGKVKN